MSQNPEPKSTENIYSKNDAYRNLDRVHFWINNCDLKSSFVLGSACVMLTILFANADFVKGIQFLLKELSSRQNCSLHGIACILGVIALAAFVLLAMSTLSTLLNVLVSRIDIQTYQEKSITVDSILFFGSLKGKGLSEFDAAIDTSNSTGQLMKDLNSQILVGSEICSFKFQKYNQAITRLKLSAIPLLVLLSCLYLLSLG